MGSGTIILIVVLAVIAAVVFLILSGIRFIPNNRVGIVEKRFGAKSIKTGFIALKGEAGFQPKLLRGGLHYRMTIQYRVHRSPLVTITQGKIGYVFARDGHAAGADAGAGHERDRERLSGCRRVPGKRRPARTRSVKILREGTYAINLAQFIIITEEQVYYLPLNRAEEAVIQNMAKVIAERDGFRPIVLKDQDDKIGIVTVQDGPSLSPGEIIAPIVGGDPTNAETYHNNFQAPDRFLKAGGLRGRQLQVLVEGTYYLNRLFATVEMIPKTIIDIGTVGVVVFYTGETGRDLSGEDYRHGELVRARPCAACGTRRSCRASTRSTRTRARSYRSRRPTSS